MRLAGMKDAELVVLVVDDNDRALDELLCRYDGRAFQIAINILDGSYDDASDAVQDARIKCWRSIAGTTIRCFEHWYLAIVRNCCQDFYKQRQRTADWLSLDEVDGVVGSPLDQLMGLEERSFLRGVVAGLPRRQSIAVRMRHLERCEYPEIAGVMGVTESTVRGRVESGLKNLKDRLDNVGAIGA